MEKIFLVQKLSRLTCQECGSALVEFALTALALMSLMFGVIGFAMAMYTYHFVGSAAQKGARFAAVRGGTWSKTSNVPCSTSAPPNFTMAYNCTASSADIQNYVQSLTTLGINPSSVTINETSSYVWPGITPDGAACATTNSQGCLVKVTVSYNFNFLLLQSIHPLSMTATSEGVILQ